jgi:heptosyltransferase-2
MGPMTRPSAPPTAQKPLIVRLRNWVGDVVLSTPTLERLQAEGHELHLIGKAWARELLAGFGWQVHTLPVRHIDRLRQLRHLRLSLSSGGRHPEGLVFPYSFSSALEMRLAGLQPTGFAYEGRALLLRQAVPRPRGLHTLEEYWALGSACLGRNAAVPAHIHWPLTSASQAQAQALQVQHDIQPGFVLACPFAGGTFEGQDKHWPGFIDFIQRLKADTGRQVVLCPGPGQEVLAAHRDHPEAITLQGVGMGTYAALLQRAALVVSNDTGPGHLAAAVRAPLLSVLGPTEPALWRPWGPTVHIERHWPRWPTVDEVLARAHSILAISR